MDPYVLELIWRGIEDANPWWKTGSVPPQRVAGFRRHAFPVIYEALRACDRGRGVVLLGPRRVGKTVLVHQFVEQFLADQVPAQDIVLLTLDDVALRHQDLGEILTLLEARRPATADRVRYLLLDEVQHSPEWSGWLKRLADRRDPYVFLATGSSATALRHGGQDAGLGRWREMTIFPWSFREHVELRKLPAWSFEALDAPQAQSWTEFFTTVGKILAVHTGQVPLGERERLETAFVDYLLRGGFPEVAMAPDLTEARRRLRQDILDRALGRDVLDTAGVDSQVLERMFLRICMAPGGLWNESEVARDLRVSRPTVVKYLEILERAFLVFRFRNLASPVKGQPKVYLVAPSMRQALLALDESAVRRPEEWGRLAENCVVSAIVGTRPDATQTGFWRRGREECDVVVLDPASGTEYIEVKRGGEKALRGIRDAVAGMKTRGWSYVLARDWPDRPAFGPLQDAAERVWHQHLPVAVWLYKQQSSAGGTLRIKV